MVLIITSIFGFNIWSYSYITGICSISIGGDERNICETNKRVQSFKLYVTQVSETVIWSKRYSVFHEGFMCSTYDSLNFQLFTVFKVIYGELNAMLGNYVEESISAGCNSFNRSSM